jgi:hypothetical protein
MIDNGASIELLKDWLKVLEDALYKMRVDQKIFRGVFEIIENNRELQARQSHFYAWMYDNYVERMAMGVRRLCDSRRKTISIVTFLRRLLGDPSIISRKYYSSCFRPDHLYIPMLPKAQNDQLRQRVINGGYDRLVGEGLQQPDNHTIKCEMAWLEGFGTLVIGYVNKRIAHHDENPPTTFPTLVDVDAFIEYAEKLLQKYIVLVWCVIQMATYPVLGEHEQLC